MEKKKEKKKDLCEDIAKWQADPKFMQAVREFIRITTS